MTDIHAGTAMSRTRPWGVKESLPTSPLEPASHVPREQRPHGTSSSARANALITVYDQRALPTLRQPPSRNSRTWVCASLFSLLVLLSIAAAYWYVTAGRVVYTNELYFDVGQVSHSTDVSAIAGNQHRTLRQILYRPHARQVQITYRQCKDRARADEADIETFERDCWRTLSDIGLQ
jgi:hypothetical protein